MPSISGFTIRHLWVVVTVAAAFIGPASSPIGLPDIYWTIQNGAWMLAHGSLLTSDPLTSAPHVPGPVVNIQWLADLFFAALVHLGGLHLVLATTAVVVTLTWALVLAAAVTASGHVRLSCVAVWIGYVLGFSNLSPRPQTLAYPLFGLCLLAVVRAEWRKDTRLLWALPPACALWANVHGSFFTAFLLLGCAGLGRVIEARALVAARPYALTLAGCVVASALTPYGPGSLVYVVSIASNPVIRQYVTEWAPTTIDWREGIFLYLSVAAIAGLLLRARLRPKPMELLLLLVFGWLAVSSVRAVVWWGLAIVPTFARLLGDAVRSRAPAGRDRPPLNLAIAAVAVLVALLSSPWTKAALPLLPADKRGVVTSDTPVALGEYLATHDPPPTGNMLNEQSWGGYLDWAAWPRHRPFLDGRIELHPTQVWLDYLDIAFPSARWRALLDAYQISYIVMSPVLDSELVNDLRQDPAWRLDYADDQAVVFTRSVAEAP